MLMMEAAGFSETSLHFYQSTALTFQKKLVVIILILECP